MISLTQFWAKTWLWVVGMPLRTIGKMPSGTWYVIVANHISYLDTVNIFAAIPFYFRPLGKIEMGKVPVFGFIYKKLAILVDRKEINSRMGSIRTMRSELQRQGSILIFPEGTFNETGDPLKSFYDGAFRLAITAGTPILPIVFPDTIHRWHFSKWYLLRPGKNRAIFLDPIRTEGYTPDDVKQLKEKVAGIMAKTITAYRHT